MKISHVTGHQRQAEEETSASSAFRCNPRWCLAGRPLEGEMLGRKTPFNAMCCFTTFFLANEVNGCQGNLGLKNLAKKD